MLHARRSEMFCIASRTEISDRIKDLAREIKRYYQSEFGTMPTVLWLTNGAMYFTSDLTREIGVPLPYVEAVKARSYDGTVSGAVETDVETLKDVVIRDRPVLIVDDILDSGKTLHKVVRLVEKRNPWSIRICVLLVKDVRRQYEIEVHYGGFSIDDVWVVGYGLDDNGAYRNQPYIGVPKCKIAHGSQPRRARIWSPSDLKKDSVGTDPSQLDVWRPDDAFQVGHRI
jgi:hypoxanthine phosphoribosyltransferase